MENNGKMHARIVGILFITATVAGILAVIFFGSILATPVDLVMISANEIQVRIGALFYFIMATAVAGIAISMYPILKKI